MIKSQETRARDFVPKLKFGKRRNTLCISSFSNRKVGTKDPTSSEADLISGYSGGFLLGQVNGEDDLFFRFLPMGLGLEACIPYELQGVLYRIQEEP